jgi:hypothetical protein
MHASTFVHVFFLNFFFFQKQKKVKKYISKKTFVDIGSKKPNKEIRVSLSWLTYNNST